MGIQERLDDEKDWRHIFNGRLEEMGERFTPFARARHERAIILSEGERQCRHANPPEPPLHIGGAQPREAADSADTEQGKFALHGRGKR